MSHISISGLKKNISENILEKDISCILSRFCENRFLGQKMWKTDLKRDENVVFQIWVILGKNKIENITLI